MQEQDKSGESDEAPEGSEEEVAAARGSDAVDAEAAALAAGEEPAEAEHAEEGEAVIHDDQRWLKGDGWVDGVRLGMRLCLSAGGDHLFELAGGGDREDAAEDDDDGDDDDEDC